MYVASHGNGDLAMSLAVNHASAPKLRLGTTPEALRYFSLPTPVCWEAAASPEVRDRLRQEASAFPSPYEDFLRYSVSCRRLMPSLPDRLLHALTLFRID